MVTEPSVILFLCTIILIIVKNTMTLTSSILKDDWDSYGPVTQFVPITHKFCSQSTDGATITVEVPEGPIRNSLQKDPFLTWLVVSWDILVAILLHSLLGIQKLSRSIFGSDLVELKSSPILFHLVESSKSERGFCWGITDREFCNTSMDILSPLSRIDMGDNCCGTSWIVERKENVHFP